MCAIDFQFEKYYNYLLYLPQLSMRTVSTRSLLFSPAHTFEPLCRFLNTNLLEKRRELSIEVSGEKKSSKNKTEGKERYSIFSLCRQSVLNGILLRPCLLTLSCSVRQFDRLRTFLSTWSLVAQLYCRCTWGRQQPLSVLGVIPWFESGHTQSLCGIFLSGTSRKNSLLSEGVKY